MKVWLITVGEPLPIDGGGDRLHRAGILSEYLLHRKHEVMWWSSSFDHVRKRHRTDCYAAMKLDSGLDLRLLHGCGYQRNISLQRIRDHREIARQFAELAPHESKPDVIVASFPTIELSLEAVRYGQRAGAPVVVDIRDLWPEIFLEVAPSWLRPLVNIPLQPLWRATRRTLSGAYAITGNSPAFVEWGRLNGGRSRNALDRHFPFGYVNTPVPAGEEKAAMEYWRERGVVLEGGSHVACFFGAFSGQFDLETVIEAARRLAGESRKIQFVLCGSGERLEPLKKLAAGLPNVIFPGWVGRAEIWTLMKLAHFGLAPYKNHVGFTGNLPNKPIEYMAGGLPVIGCLTGYLREFLAENRCGLFYQPGSVDDLCSVMRRAADDTSGRMEMASNARKCFTGKFDADTVYNEMVGYLEKLATSYPQVC